MALIRSVASIGPALLADAAGERRMGRVFGIVNAASTIGIVVGSTLAAQLWEQVDIGAGMLVAVVVPFVAVGAMLAFRPRTVVSAA